VRNLPKKEFYEPELRALMITVMDQYKTATSGVKESSKKLITQTKILRDAEKTVQVDTSNANLKGDLGTSYKASSGLAFVELATHEAALFTVRYLNNMQLTSRGLIVDFCLQDARKMFRRTQKLEKHQRLAMEKKDALKKERRNEKRAKLQAPEKVATVEMGKLGKRSAQEAERAKPETVSSVNDLAKLAKMKEESISRGKKQRINKKIASITGDDTKVKE
jgi:hypothetical protein